MPLFQRNDRAAVSAGENDGFGLFIAVFCATTQKIPQGKNSSLRSDFLVTRHAFFGSWRRRSQVRSGFHDSIMTGATVAMKRLLVGQNRRLVAPLKL